MDPYLIPYDSWKESYDEFSRYYDKTQEMSSIPLEESS